MPVGLITGASRGLGYTLTAALAARGWRLIVDARDGTALRMATDTLARPGQLIAIPGDVTDPAHRSSLAAVVAGLGRLDLLVNNASDLGPSPLPALDRYPIERLNDVYRTNTLAPLAMIQLLLPALRLAGGTIINISSDAAVEPYPGWGGYGSSKAALDQLTAILAAEQPGIRIYAFDPGDMRTAMHQQAFPGEDISDRPEPETVIPSLLHLLEASPPSGRYRASDLLAAARSGT